MRFPVNFAKFQRTPSFTEHLRWLLLNRFILTFQRRVAGQWSTMIQ